MNLWDPATIKWITVINNLKEVNVVDESGRTGTSNKC